MQTDKLIVGFVAVIIGVALIAPLQEFVNDANVTGATATIVSLIPLFFGLAILLGVVKSVMGGGK